MKTAKELKEDILIITMRIDEIFPELSKYIAEIPLKISYTLGNPNSIKNLKEYYNSLEALFEHYSTYHKNKPNQRFITMTTTTKLGIWMDHSTAHLTEFTIDPIETKTIDSPFTHQEKESSLGSSENVMHNKEQHHQAAFYKKLGEIIRNYEEVILFGPTNAKAELFNILKKDHLFADIKIEVIQADKMTENQEHAFIKEHFSKC